MFLLARYDDLADYDWLMKEIILHESVQADALGDLLVRELRPQSVIDVGCGPGIYLLPFKRAGIPVYGVDGAPGAGLSLSAAEFSVVDLRQPWTPTREYDLALCIEVAEHIRPEFADVFVDTLCACAPVVFFSAAGPGQGGEGHYNEQPQPYWEARFSSRRFRRDQEMTARLHQTLDVDAAYEHCHWLRWNSVLFRREGL